MPRRPSLLLLLGVLLFLSPVRLCDNSRPGGKEGSAAGIFTAGALKLAAMLLPAPALAADSGAGGADDQPSDMPGYSMGDLRRLADRVQRTGIGQDRIPALYRPQFVTVSDASLSMDDDEFVFIIEYPDGRVRIYPQRIMVWHEVVNDVLPDAEGRMPPASVPGMNEASQNAYTLTYCPLTGSVRAFRSVVSKYVSTFGVTGNLLNGNSVLYDRLSQSLWSQLLGACLEGPFRGKRVQSLQVLWARWGGAKVRYAGKAEVLSTATGHKRPYGRDPYGNYHVKGSYYDDVRLLFAISRMDQRLPLKTRILGIESDAAYGAVIVDEVKKNRVLNFTLGVAPMAALYDEELDAVRVFDRRVPGWDKPLTFALFENKLVDQETRSQWDPLGRCVYGRFRDRRLPPVLSVDAMWFAWAAFHRGTMYFPNPEWQ